MKSHLAFPGPGTYKHTPVVGRIKADYKPVIIQCFFKGADKCTLCDEVLHGDYYKDGRKKRPFSWCLECFRFAVHLMPRTYVDSIKKHRHCSFAHKHIDVENIVYQLVHKGAMRKMLLREKIMWNKYGEMRDSKGLPF